MELVYLWVEDYKNIHNQGFNFSPRFRCEYDKDKNELTIENNVDYISNFFGENINVTAIVGKNGSGKSSVLKAFLESFLKTKKDVKTSIYIDKNKKLTEKDKDNKDYALIYWDYSITDEGFLELEVDHNNSELDKSKRHLILPPKVDKNGKSKIDLKYDLQELAKNILMQRISFDILKEFFEPKIILLATDKSLNGFIDYKNEKEGAFFDDYYEKKKNIYKFDFNEQNIENINSIISKDKDCLVEFITKENKKLIFLSFGEIQLLKILVNIQKYINHFKNRKLIFLLDELELGLHPNWQKKIIAFLTKFNIPEDKKVHFILTTHSPFLISDLPRQNIIFLDKDENGNCKVVDGLNEKKKTFGANIHTLLSDSFFMEDGLMGEFAKSKIQEIIDFFNNKNSIYANDKKKLKKVIESIGEAFLKDKLLRMYGEKYPLTDEERIKALEEQIASIKNGQN